MTALVQFNLGGKLSPGVVPPDMVQHLDISVLSLDPLSGPMGPPEFDVLSEASPAVELTEVGERFVGQASAQGEWFEDKSKDAFAAGNVVIQFDVPYCIIN